MRCPVRDPAPFVIAEVADRPPTGGEALAHLAGRARLARTTWRRPRRLDSALTLSRRHGFDYLTLQCLSLLGVVAGTCVTCAGARVSSEALSAAADHAGRPHLSAAATRCGLTELLRSAPAMPTLTADALASGAASPPRGTRCHPSTVPRLRPG